MTNGIAVVTTFANSHFEPFAKQMLQSFVACWPPEIQLLVALDNDLLAKDVERILTSRPRMEPAICTQWSGEHKAFVERNKDKDHPQDYRQQPVRFCHKVFAIKHAMDAIGLAKNNPPRYLIWLDADVHMLRQVTMEDIRECLPKEGDAVSYMGRKEWDHSECGWMAFDLQNGGAETIDFLYNGYVSDRILGQPQKHDSWAFDRIFEEQQQLKRTNLTPNATGRDVWQQSPMGKWSTHHKGPAAKAQLAGTPLPPQEQQPRHGRIQVKTRNSIPHEEICKQIARNQTLIKNWIRPCKPTDEELVVVSAGPMLIAEEVRAEVEAGKKVVAVKNALVPLKKAGIKPWACILLDPRPHVANFVEDADSSVLWFVASQVNPIVTMELLVRGCKVWGYHAPVNAGEERLTALQEHAQVSGGSATATRGLFMLYHLGFSNFTLYGYDLCLPDKPDMKALNEFNEPKYLELSVNMHNPFYEMKRMFFTEAQYYAQFEEMDYLVKSGLFKVKAHGDGIVPFMIKSKNISDLRQADLRRRLLGDKPMSYKDLLQKQAAKGE